MAKPKPKADPTPFKLRAADDAARAAKPLVHMIRKGVRCGTEKRGFATPDDRPPSRIVVDASEGFIPLWDKDQMLRWRFQDRSMQVFEDPAAAAAEIETLFGEALLAWGDAAPVKFTKDNDAWDFEIVMSGVDDCDPNGCVLAAAFFPDQGRHELWMYPKLFTQTRDEQVATFAHEVGHIFGLRHFFANITERRWRSEIFGDHVPFSIMNYGEESVLTETDRIDLARLYQFVWSGDLREINGTPIRLWKPYHVVNETPPAIITATGGGGNVRLALRR